MTIRVCQFLFVCLSAVFITSITYGAELVQSASEYHYPPFSVVTNDNKADGFSVELLRAALKSVDRDVSFYVGEWDVLMVDLAEGRIQVLPVVGRTPEREKFFDFTFPYLTFYGAVFTTKEKNLKSVSDLKGKTLVVMSGDNAEEYARRVNLSSSIKTVPTYDEAFEMLSRGECDAVVAQGYMGEQIIKSLEISNVVAAFRLGNFKQEFTFAVKKGDSDLLELLEEGLSRVILNGTLSDLFEKWF